MSRACRRSTTVLLVFALALVACSGPSAAPNTSGTRTPTSSLLTANGVYEVSYAPGTVVIDAATLSSNRPTVSEDGKTYIFPTAAGLTGISAGNTIILAGVALRKVTAVSEAGTGIVLKTESAALTDAITKGTIRTSGAVNWQQVTDGYLATHGPAPVLTAMGSGGDVIAAEALHRAALTPRGSLSFTGKVQGFDVEFSLKPTPDSVGFSLSASRANLKVTAKGTVSNFNLGSELVFDPDSESLVSSEAMGLKADAEVTWAAFSSKQPTLDETVTSFQVPLSLPIPISAGPIPLVLTIKANVRIVPALSVDKASSGGSFAISYTSDQGFDIKGKQPSPLAKLYASNAELGSTETVTAGFGPVGFGFGVEFPRMELGILGSGGPYAFTTIYSYATGEWTPGTTLTSDIPPCQKAGLTLSAIAGYKLQVLGGLFGAVSDQTTLWQNKWDKYKDDVPCTLTGK